MFRGAAKLPDARKPIARSVELAVTPFAKLYDPPAEVEFKARRNY
jgi:hypothetical protein